MLTLLSAADTPLDPIWLRTLATVLPVLGTIVVGILATPAIVAKLKKDRQSQQDRQLVNSLPEPTAGGGLPAPVAIAATERASSDPIIRLFIEDLHQRLSSAHSEAAELHTQRATDAATIARITTELADCTERLAECERELAERTTKSRIIQRRLEELKEELELTQRRLSICMEGYEAPS